MTCYCHTCKRAFQSLGIARHRAMHRDKDEYCEITYGSGETYCYNWTGTHVAECSCVKCKP